VKSVRILGTRGVPARHGGFETFAEKLALYLVGRGWEVVVYCQQDGRGDVGREEWNGVQRVLIPVDAKGPLGTAVFDWKATVHATAAGGLLLVLGYNTAVLNLWPLIRRVSTVVNMDGLEWQRAKWPLPMRAWLYINDWLGCWIGDHLIADNPGIAAHLETRVRREKISTIPYGADRIVRGDSARVRALGLEPDRFLTLIARPEPENSILEIVSAFSQKPRGYHLAVLGNFDQDRNKYHASVVKAASDEVRFLGAIYDKEVVADLRAWSRVYIHGHQVGGTNPSLVEALGAGNPVLAHDNTFNRWVAGDGAHYFQNMKECAAQLNGLLDDDEELSRMSLASRQRHAEAFTWEMVLRQYEELLARWQNGGDGGGNTVSKT
jgi:glycosyltransferase involved in cell wall biosynthesis